VLVIDEAGQLGNRQALRVLEISRVTGARLILLGDNKGLMRYNRFACGRLAHRAL
jgi:hypothetical protein